MAQDYGFRIAQVGYDVKTATDSQLSLTSKLNSFKIPTTLQGSTTLSIAPSSSATKTIAHNLGYIPTYEAWYEDENSVWHSVFELANLGSSRDINADSFNISPIDNTNVYIKLKNLSGGSTRVATIYYIVFLEVAS